jgi:glucose-1-phosphate thymidylyltransferase
MKGIVLAGGLGSRLVPLTRVASKQLLPVYDKPLIYYPISTLMLANIKDILIIAAPGQMPRFKELLGDGSDFGVNLTYKVQQSPSGIAESLILGKDFLNSQKVCLVLGDNIFHGPGLGRRLETFNEVSGAQVFGYKVNDPSPYGIATVTPDGIVSKLEEKPKNSDSKVAIPGLYFFDESAPLRSETLQPSARGELEILDLLQTYLSEGLLKLEMLPRGTAWFDSGTFNDLHEAGSYVRLMQERTGERVGDPIEIGSLRGWVK